MPTTTNTVTMDLDVAADSPYELEDCLAVLTEAAPGLVCTPLAEAGPAGWPLFRFEVPAAHLEAFLEAYGVD